MPAKLRSSVAYSHAASFLYNAFFTITTGIFLNDYMLRIGFNEYDVGMLYAFFYLTGFIVFPISFMANAIQRKKAFYAGFHFLALGFFLLFIAAPYIPGIGTRAVVWISIVSMGLFAVASGIGRLVLMPWLYEVVGNQRWAGFFRFRLILAYAVPVLVLAGFGYLLDRDGIGVLSVLFVAAFVLAALSVVCMILFPDSRSETVPENDPKTLRAIFRQMRDSSGFDMILAYCTLLSFGIGLFTPVIFPYLITRMGVESSTLSLFQILMTVTSIGATYWMIRVCDRQGTLAALIRVSAILWTVPVMMLLVPYSVYPGTAMLFALGAVDGYGIVFTGTYIVLTNLSLEFTPHKNKTVFMAFIEWIKALFMSAGSYLGGWIAHREGKFVIGSFHTDGYGVVFVLSLLLMLAAFFVALRIRWMLQKAQSPGTGLEM